MAKKSAAGLLTSVGELFTTQEERNEAQRSYVTDLPTGEISDFPNHPFKVRMDESMVELADSVKQYGILAPLIVRPTPEGGYEMVSGHRRKRAAELAGLPSLPCIVRELTDDEAIARENDVDLGVAQDMYNANQWYKDKEGYTPYSDGGYSATKAAAAAATALSDAVADIVSTTARTVQNTVKNSASVTINEASSLTEGQIARTVKKVLDDMGR